MWTHEDKYDILPNLYIRHHYQDGELSHYQIYPVDGYWLRITTSDTQKVDENGKPMFDEKGQPIIIPYRTDGGAVAKKTYDFVENPNGYIAEVKSDVK